MKKYVHAKDEGTRVQNQCSFLSEVKIKEIKVFYNFPFDWILISKPLLG